MTELAKALCIQEEEESLAALLSDDDDDFVPDSLKDFFKEADAALNAKLMDFDTAVQGTSFHLPDDGDHNESGLQTPNASVIAAMAEFTPMTETKGPYDTDLGSACHPNPANDYCTHTQAKQVVYLQNGSSHECNLNNDFREEATKETSPSPKNNNKLSSFLTSPSKVEPISESNGDAVDMEDTPEKSLGIEEESDQEKENMLTQEDIDPDDEVISLEEIAEENTDISMKETQLEEDDAEKTMEDEFLPNVSMVEQDPITVLEEKMQESTDKSNILSLDETHDQMKVSLPQYTVDDSLDDESFLPNSTLPKLLKEKSLTSKSQPVEKEKCSVERKPAMLNANKPKLTPKSNNSTPNSMNSTNNKGIKNAVSLAKERVRRQLRLRNKDTSPQLSQSSRNSIFSNSSFRSTKKVSPINHQPTDADCIVSPPVQEAVNKYKQRVRRALQVQQQQYPSSLKLTIPKSPDLETKHILGKKKYSSSGPHKENNPEANPIQRAFSDEVTNSKDDNASVGTQERQLTLPKAPRLSTSKKYGDKPTPTSHNIASNHLNFRDAPSCDNQTNITTRKLTVPKAPRLSTSQKYGPKSTPTAKSNEETKKPSTNIETSSAVKSKERPRVTTPKPFHFHSQSDSTQKRPKTLTMMETVEKLLRKGFRNDSTPPAIDSNPRRLTIPKTPNFVPPPQKTPPKSTAELEEEMMQYYKKHPFQARPVGAGVYSSSVRAGSVGDYGVPKVHKKSLTTPTPFELATERRAEQTLPAQSTEEIIALENKPFKARPMPDFSGRPPVKRRTIKKKTPVEEPVDIKPFQARPMPNFRRIPSIRNANIQSRKKKMENTQQLVDEAQKHLKSWSRRELTEPKPFKLSVRRTKVSTLPLEEEAPKSFKARSVPTSLFQEPSIKPKSRVSNPKPKRNEKCENKSSSRTLFKARPVPSFVRKVPAVTKTTPRAVTEPSPFTFNSPKANRRSDGNREDSSSPSTMFKARPVPSFVKKAPVVRKTTPRAVTEPSPFKFSSPKSKRRSNGNSEDSSSQNATFKARPMPTFDKKAPVPRKTSPKALTETSPFVFQSDLRSATRRIRSTVPKQNNMDHTPVRKTSTVCAGKVASKISPTVKKTVTTPKPFTLRCDERHNEHAKHLQEKVKAEMEEAFRPFQAKPVPKSTFQTNFSPTKVQRPLIEPKGPELRTEVKAQSRKEYLAKVEQKQKTVEILRRKKEDYERKMREKELRRLRSMPVSQGGFIPEAKPILYNKSSGFSTMQSPRARSWSESSSENIDDSEAGEINSEGGDTASGLRSLISGFGKVKLRP